MSLIRFNRMAAVIFALKVLTVGAQNITWVGPAGITGDANLSTNGTYFDALMPNTSITPTLAVGSTTFNTAASIGGGAFGDGKISYAGSGLNNYGWPNSFPVGGLASA